MLSPRRLAIVSLLLPVLVLAAHPPAQMAEDVRTEPIRRISFPGYFPLLQMDGRLYFGADDGVHGFELWRTDGTPSGTELVADVCPGRCSGVLGLNGTVAGGLLFFNARHPVDGFQPWVSDGTPEGTRRLVGLPGRSIDRPCWFQSLGDRAVFDGRSEEHGRELWISDGTAAGTVQLADLRPGPEGSDPGHPVLVEDRLFFEAEDGVHGRETWVSDGTPAGTRMVVDLQPGSEGSTSNYPCTPIDPRNSAAFGDRYYFIADDGTHGSALWATDGSAAGTRLVKDFPSHYVAPPGFRVFDSNLYFVVLDASAWESALWRTDGTTAGTVPVTGFPGGPARVVASSLTVAGSRLYFSGWTDEHGEEPWFTDGTMEGTGLVADVRSGSEGSWEFWQSADGGFEFPDGRLLFFPHDGIHGSEPWVSDGTAGGTYLLHDVFAGEGWSFSSIFGAYSPPSRLGDALFFFAQDSNAGFELWRSDGTVDGTRLLRDLDDQASSLPVGFWFPITEVASVGSRWFFQALDDEHGVELWQSGGTPGTTSLVADLATGPRDPYELEPLGSHPSWFAPLEERLVFTASSWEDSTRRDVVWSTDREGNLDRIGIGGQSTLAGGAVFFNSDDGFRVTDGTPAGTHLIEGVESGSWAVAVEDVVFFSGRSPETGTELYRLDPDAGRATLVADLVAGTESSVPSQLAAVDELLFFSATTPTTGTELWVSDGTSEGTRLLSDLAAGPESSIQVLSHYDYGYADLPSIVGHDGKAFVVADDRVHGSELWVSDGTPAGTRLLADLRPGPTGSEPRWLTPVGDLLCFVADDGVHGYEPWCTDGTSQGTRQVADLEPGEASSLPGFLVEVDGVLYFSAYTAASGMELWRWVPGSAPEVAADVVPGPESSSPSYLGVAGRRLFFFASDGVHGYEPWSVVLPSRHLRATLEASPTGGVGEVLLTVHLYNDTPIAQPDAEGDEFRLPLPPGVVPGVPTATSGIARVVLGGPVGPTALPAASRLNWNGGLAAGESVTLTLLVRNEEDPSSAVVLQGEIAFDTDGDGVNDLAVPSDDPRQPGDEDPTVLPTGASILEVPALSEAALLLLASLLGVAAVRRLRST